jgi:hypothetical protein
MTASIVGVGIIAGEVFVGRAVEVDSIPGTSVAVQAARRKATMMSFFIEGNYMLHVVARRSEATTKQSPLTITYSSPNFLSKQEIASPAARNDMNLYGVAPTKLSAYNASS